MADEKLLQQFFEGTAPAPKIQLFTDFTLIKNELQPLATIQSAGDRDSVGGLLYVNDVKYEVDVIVRGQSSPNELEFPKLFVLFKGEPPPMWAGLKKISIATHGFNTYENKVTNMGRLASPLWVYREATIFDLAKQVLGLTIRNSRRVNIQYINTGTSLPLREGWAEVEIPRDALPAAIMEPMGHFAKSLGAKEKDTKGDFNFKEVKAFYTENDLAKLAMIEAMFGNWDYMFPTIKDKSHLNYHNVTVLKFSNESKEAVRFVNVLEDLDMASAVTGNPRVDPKMPANFMGDEPDLLKRYLGWQLRETKARFTKKAWNEAKAEMMGYKEALLEKLKELEVDEGGRELIKKHILLFYELINTGLRISPQKDLQKQMSCDEVFSGR